MNFQLRSVKIWLLSAMVMCVSMTVEASHYRYGNISWERVAGGSGYRVQFKGSIAWRKSYTYQWSNATVGSVVSAGIYFRTHSPSSGTGLSPQMTVTSINTSEDWMYGEFTWTYDYGGPGNFQPGWYSNARIGTLVNNANRPFINRSSLSMTAPYGSGNVNTASPVTSVSPIVNMSTGLNPATIVIPTIDPDGDAVTYRLANPGEAGSLVSNPANVSIDPATGVLSFVTTSTSPGQLYNIIVVAEDGRGGSTMIDFIVRIVGQSTPPVFVSPTPANGTSYQIQPGQTLNFTVKAIDNDQGDNVTLNAVGVPPGATMTPGLPTTGVQQSQSSFSWTPTNSNLGTSVLNFTATDATGVQVSTSVSINVSLKPVFSSTTPGTGSFFCLAPGENFNQYVEASDPDPTDVVVLTASGVNATYSPALPTTAANPSSTTVDYTPVASDWGVHMYTLTATDSYGDSRSIYWTFLVNTPPHFTSTPIDQVNIGQTYTYLITTGDADAAYGDAVDMESATIPSWLTLIDNNNGTWTLTGTPTLADVGVHQIELEIEDQYNHYQGTHCGHTHQEFDLEVIPCNLSLSGAVSNVSCNAGADGAIDLTVTGANGQSTYSWSNGATTEDVSGLAAGTYTVSITDGYGCTESATFTVGEPTAITYNFSSTPILCNGGLSQQSVTIFGGTPPYTVTNQGGGALVIGLGEGITAGGATYAASYVYTITDANGCQVSFNANITQPAALTASSVSATYVGGWNVSCNGATNGSVDLTVAGGTAPYSYAWSNGSSVEDLSGVGAGTYSVVITDANGCSTSLSGITLTEPSTVTSSLSVSPAIGVNPGGQANTIYIGYGPQSLTLNASAAGGTAPYSYSWTNSGSLSSGSGSTVSASPTSSTTYTVTATDANGCSSSQTVTIEVVDVRCGKRGNKVLVCKVPPGNPGNAHTICVSPNAVAAHLATGSYLGNCTNKTDAWDAPTFTVFPNPSAGLFTLSFDLDESARVEYQVLDMSGRLITNGQLDEHAGHYQVQVDMTNQPSGMYLIRFITDNSISTERISISR